MVLFVDNKNGGGLVQTDMSYIQQKMYCQTLKIMVKILLVAVDKGGHEVVFMTVMLFKFALYLLISSKNSLKHCYLHTSLARRLNQSLV